MVLLEPGLWSQIHPHLMSLLPVCLWVNSFSVFPVLSTGADDVQGSSQCRGKAEESNLKVLPVLHSCDPEQVIESYIASASPFTLWGLEWCLPHRVVGKIKY